MAGVANIGNDINWTGHPFAQANWYALGRLAWDYNLTSEQIAENGYEKLLPMIIHLLTNAKKIMLLHVKSW